MSDVHPARQRLLLWSSEAGDEDLVGYFSLGEIVRGALKSAFLGYWGVLPHTSRGYMSAGMELLLRHAFRTTRLHRLEANIQPENRASIALVRDLGFHKEGLSRRYLKVAGRWRDHERWATIAEEWRQPRAGSGRR